MKGMGTAKEIIVDEMIWKENVEQKDNKLVGSLYRPVSMYIPPTIWEGGRK